MTYELAKKLKDAGWPQTPHELTAFVNNYTPQTDIALPSEQWLAVPTLHRLIEACGEDFGELYRFPSSWSAEAYENNHAEGEGKTPEEAVANLWLALQTKRTNT